MTFDPPILAAARKGLCPQGKQFGPSAAARWMGVILAVVLFAVDAFHPVIRLVEVPRAADKTQSADQPADGVDSEQPASPTVVSIHAWQWNPSNAEFCPAFVFQPTISAGSSGAAGSIGSTASLAAAALPSAFTSSVGAIPLACRRRVQLPGQLPPLCLTACRDICPMGPPLV